VRPGPFQDLHSDREEETDAHDPEFTSPRSVARLIPHCDAPGHGPGAQRERYARPTGNKGSYGRNATPYQRRRTL